MNLVVAALVLRFGWGNDLWADPPPADDAGFTNDIAVAADQPLAGDTLQLSALHRMITERYGQRRWDQVELGVGWQRAAAHGPLVVAVAPRLGLGLGGNFGGRALQNGWHGATGTGPTLDEGLQDTYAGGRRAALLVGLRAVAEERLDFWLTPFVAVDGQAALGSTGLSRIETSAGVRFEPPLRRTRLLIAAELAVARFSADDPNLRLAGGYATGTTELALRLSLGLTGRRFQFGWQFRSNEGGSGEPIGLLWLTLAR